MQTVRLPRQLCDDLERLMRAFIWGSTGETRKIHLTSWDTVCQSKKAGGLGIKHIRSSNDALLAKLGWALLTNPQALWVQVLRAKYRVDLQHTPTTLARVGASSLWRGLAATWHVIRRGLHWQLGNGRRVLFWTDNWLSAWGPLLSVATSPVPDSALSVSVADFRNPDGTWQWHLFQQYLPSTVCLDIAALYPATDSNEDDTPQWSPTAHGRFTVASAYDLLEGNTSDTHNHLWTLIWKWDGPQRIRAFLWLLAKGKLLTNQQRLLRHLATDGACHHCGHDESILHALRDCQRARAIWMRFPQALRDPMFFLQDDIAWLSSNLTKHHQVCSFSWSSIFGVTCWFLWYWRNQSIFVPDAVWPEAGDRAILDYLDWMARARVAERRVFPTRGLPLGSLVGWSKPPEDWVKLNTDGAVKQGGSLSTAGGGSSVIAMDSGVGALPNKFLKGHHSPLNFGASTRVFNSPGI